MNKLGKVAVALAMVFSVGAAGAADSEATMQARLQVAKYAGETTLENFPVLVRISPQNIEGFDYALCRADGSDIRFVDGSGTAIGFEIEQWNPNGESLVWVNLPTLSAGTTFFMQWGGSAVSHESSDAWNANYAGVWHMDEQSGVCFNSTRHGTALNATPKGNVENSARYNGPDAPVGGARTTATSAANGYLSVTNYDSLALGDTFTVSGWMRMTAATGCARVFSRKTTYTSGDGWECEMGSGVYDKCSSRGASVTSVAATFATSAENNWVHVALVYNGTTLTVFGDGEQLASGTIAKATDNGQPLSFGCDSDGNEAYVRGAFDECRLMDGAASADWVKAEYDSIVDRAFISYGSAEWLTDDPALAVGTPVVLAAGDNNVSFQLAVSGIGEGATSATLSLVYGTAADEMTEERTVAELTERGFTAAVLGRLYPDQTYYVKAVARNNLGDVAESKVITVTTLLPADVFAQPGLKQTYFTSANAKWDKDYSELPAGTDWKHYTDADRVYRRELGVIAAYLGGTPGTTKYVSEVWGDDVYWPGNGGQWAYWGEMYLDASRTYRFRMHIDDCERVVITNPKTGKDEVLLEDIVNGSGLVTSGDYKPSVSGWHRIDVRLSDNMGGAGGYNSADSYKNTSNMGYSDDGGFSWKLLLDPGDGSLLRTIDRRLVEAAEVVSGSTLSGVKLTFEAAETGRELHVVWGAVHGGNAPADWAHDDAVATVAAGETTVTVDPPAAWGEDECVVMRYYFAGGTPNWSNSLYWRVYGEPVKSVTVTGEPEEWAAPNPGYGIFRDLKAGQPCTFTCPSATTNDEEGVVYVCDGWRHTLADGTETTGTDCSLTFTYAEETACSTVTWLFHRQYKVTTSVDGEGRIEAESAWFDEGAVAAFTAVPSEGWIFWRWDGTAAEGNRQRYAAVISVSVDEPKTLTARFCDPTKLPKTLYVTPGGAGTKDGTSWENASDDLAVAYDYAAVGTTADNPREVRLAAGFYTIASTIEMKPYVHVIGAEDGETILCGDQGKADYWRIYNSGNLGNVIQDGKVYLPDYPADPYMCIAAFEQDSDTEHAFACTTTDSPANVFRNLTFTLFKKSAIFAEGASVEGLTIDNCRFYANNIMIVTGGTGDAGTVDLRRGSATVKNSIFRYTGYGVRFADASETAGRNRVENCQFLNNYVRQQYSTTPTLCGTGGVVARDNSLVDIVGCTFFRCVYKEGNLNDGQNAAGAVSISSTGPSGSSSVISNCLFNANATDNTYGNSACVQAGQRNLLEIIGCTFVSNLFRTGNSGYSSSPCVTVRNTSARLIVRDSYFADNALTNSAAASGDVPHGSVLSHSSGVPVTFLNCTLERNRVDMPNYTGTCGPATLCVPRGSKFALVNCTLADNDVFGSEGRRLAEIARDTVHNSSDLNIVNTVMTHEAPDYLPFIEGFQSQRGTILATSVIKNFTWGEDVSKYAVGCTDYGFLLTPVKPTTEVEMTLTALKRQGYAAARGICPGATRWVQKGGTPVYRGSDDRFYVYNPTSPATKEKPWWCLDQHQGKFTDAQMEAVGITRGVSPVVPDAFGAARSAKKLALGPLNVVPGLMLLVK